MQTYSHFLLTALWRQRLRDKGIAAAPISLLVGSVLPDAPLTLLTIGFIADRRYWRPNLGDDTRCSPTYNDLFFHNKYWISAYNLFHAPFMLFLYGVIGYWGMRRGKSWGEGLFWLAVGGGCHAGIDLFTHVDDGPLLYFPFDWQTRFRAPVSYWDKKHGGRTFTIFEHLLDLWLIIRLLRL